MLLYSFVRPDPVRFYPTGLFLTLNAVIYYGLGRHLEDLDITLAEAKYWHAMVQEIEEHAYTIGIGAAQLSLLALYWRVFAAMDGARMTIIVLSFLAMAWIVVRVCTTCHTALSIRCTYIQSHSFPWPCFNATLPLFSGTKQSTASVPSTQRRFSCGPCRLTLLSTPPLLSSQPVSIHCLNSCYSLLLILL